MTVDPNLFHDVVRCHQRLEGEEFYHGGPRELPGDLGPFRLAFALEEVAEYAEAFADGDLEKMLDALVDRVYVDLGTAAKHGFWRFNPAWLRVHGANLAKVRDAAGGTKFTKPPGWKAPDLSDLVAPAEGGPGPDADTRERMRAFAADLRQLVFAHFGPHLERSGYRG